MDTTNNGAAGPVRRIYRKKGPNRERKYNEEQVQQAIRDHFINRKSIREVAKLYEVPRSTLTDQIKKMKKEGKGWEEPWIKSKRGPPPIFGEDIEAQAVAWVKGCQKVGFPVTKQQLRSTLGQVAKEKGLSHKFSKDGIPGERFMGNFLKRNNDLTVRIAEPTHGGRVTLTKERILNFFTTQKEQLLTDEKLTENDFTNPDLWFNCDETMIRYDPPLPVLAQRGSKNVFKNCVNEKDGLTVLACVNPKGATEMTGLYDYWRSVENEYQSEVRATSIMKLCTSTPLSSIPRVDFNLPHLPEGPLAPIAVPVIDVEETTSSSNQTFDRGMSPAHINEALQESPPISPNKNTFANFLPSSETPYIRDKFLSGITLPSCSSDIASEFHFPMFSEIENVRVIESERIKQSRAVDSPKKKVEDMSMQATVDKLTERIRTPTKHFFNVPVANQPKNLLSSSETPSSENENVCVIETERIEQSRAVESPRKKAEDLSVRASVDNLTERIRLTPTKHFFSVPVANQTKRRNTIYVYPSSVISSEMTISWLKDRERGKKRKENWVCVKCRGSWKEEHNRSEGEYWVECSQDDCNSKMHRFCITQKLARQSAAFSRVSQMLSKDRNRLDIVKRGDLRLSLTSIEPNINKLAEKNRPLGSH
ncbi:hypothetical protein QYM36_009406 [Artemia franciscana]|uniref:HTH CENPB-type domain-containing protein n=1 Tax=Artemia franciscana TaxID=6661 RepID=A0AA88L5D0_ARTSF|nr:hypothetical protein QYM36_009406 [Artemia franciscana]